MNIHINQKNNTTEIAFQGDFKIDVAAELYSRLAETNITSEMVILNCNDLGECDVTYFQILLTYSQRLKTAGKQIVILDENETLRTLSAQLGYSDEFLKEQ